MLPAFLGLSAFSLNNAFEASAEKAQQRRLINYIYTIITAAELDASNKLQLSDVLTEPLFYTTNSGLYAQITAGNQTIWQSPSSLGRFVALPEHPGPSNEYYSVIELNSGAKLLNLAYGTIWENEQGEEFEFTINVSEDLDTIEQQTAGFQRSLWYWLGGTGLMLLIVQSIILRWGLQPLHHVSSELNDIESGDRKRLSRDYPKELDQLTRNINTLLDHEQSRRERYKDSLANLAHSLKTPLAVFRGELENSNDIAALKLTGHEQVERIASIVDYQLQRAATEGQSSLLAPVSLGKIIHKILSSLDKVYQDKGIHHQFEIERDIYIHADEGDMYELLGNLLENAYKYCNKHVNIIIRVQQKWVSIQIEDDGDGIPLYAQPDITKRGKRIDTQVEGQGLGLAIASDIIDAYHGEIKLERSYLGGARFIIKLPKH